MTNPAELLARLEARDTTLWPDGSEAPTRLGWLDVIEEMKAAADELTAWANSITAKNIVLIGMGGSSLGPEVLRACSNNERLFVLDTTDPSMVASAPIDDTFFLVSSKSGGTLEIRTLFAYFWDKVQDGSRFAAITDLDTGLADLAAEKQFGKVFINRADIGGRYSVLSYFGLVPAALMGYDIHAVLDAALSVDKLEAVQLGLDMGNASLAGRDKVTIQTDTHYESFGLWVEQLIAESTGKQGKGCVPIPTTQHEPGSDRFNISVSPASSTDLGREFIRWEIATAIAGHVLNIDPFDQPNVTESKENTARVLEHLPLTEDVTHVADHGNVIAWLKGNVTDGDYVSIQAYLPYSQQKRLAEARTRVRDALGGIAVTAGFGPRFLHSTGQLHKGGPNTCVAVQVIPGDEGDAVEIPGFPYTFNTLIRAQAEGDLQSLLQHGRRVVRVHLDNLDGLL